MDIMLKDGDFLRDARGYPRRAQGDEELLQRAMIRLTVRRGSFLPDPALGSGLHTLGGIPPAQRDAQALSLARQALLPLGQVTVESARCALLGDRLALTLGLRLSGTARTLEVSTAL